MPLLFVFRFNIMMLNPRFCKLAGTTYCLNDKTFKHFFNAEAADSESDIAIKAFLKYIETRESNNTLTDKIKTAVENIKNIQATKGAYMIEHLKIRDAMRRGLEEGIAQQKAKDEVIFAQKDSQINRQNSILSSQAEQIRQLQARLKAAGLSPPWLVTSGKCMKKIPPRFFSCLQNYFIILQALSHPPGLICLASKT